MFLTVYACFLWKFRPERGPPSMMSCQGQRFTHESTIIPDPLFARCTNNSFVHCIVCGIVLFYSASQNALKCTFIAGSF